MKKLLSLLLGAIVLCALAAWLVPREECCAAEPGARTAILTPEKMVETIQAKLPYKAKVLEPGKGK